MNMLKGLQQYSMFNRYLAPALEQRRASKDWFENRVLRDIVLWVPELESTLQAADLDSVLNSCDIFGGMRGTEPDYDERLFDALAEVRLVSWARQHGFDRIEKVKRLKRTSDRTPDFRMAPDRVYLAEATHFQTGDDLVYFVADRLDGLALKTGTLSQIGLRVGTDIQYSSRRDLVLHRPNWIEWVRNSLTEGMFISLAQSVEASSGGPIQILDGLLVVERDNNVSPGRVLPSVMRWIDPDRAVRLCLSRLEIKLTEKLTQIRNFMTATHAQVDHAVVFFSGVDEWDLNWNCLWKALDAREAWALEQVDSIRQAAGNLIDMPFELIVGKYHKEGEGSYGPLEYVPFPFR